MNRFDRNLEPAGFVSRPGSLATARPALSGPGRAAAPARHAGTGFQRWSKRVAETLATWENRRRYRRELAQMDDHLLSDIGLTPGAARAEANKPFWRA